MLLVILLAGVLRVAPSGEFQLVAVAQSTGAVLFRPFRTLPERGVLTSLDSSSGRRAACPVVSKSLYTLLLSCMLFPSFLAELAARNLSPTQRQNSRYAPPAATF